MANTGLELEGSLGVYSKYSNSYTNTREEKNGLTDSYLDFDGYLKLLVAQMSNQDFNDPMSDSEVLNQLAQYSMLEGIKNMTQQTNISYASSLVGKVVTVSENGMYMTGRIDSVTIYDGEPWIVIRGNAFKSSSVTDIVDDGAYEELKSYIGKTVKTVDKDGVVHTGEVQNILFIGGEGYVYVGGSAYAVSDVEIIDPSEIEGEEGEDNTDGVEGEGGVEGEEGVEGEGGIEDEDTVGNDETLVTDTPENGGSSDAETVSMSSQMVSLPNSVSFKAQSLADLLIKEIDRVNLAAGVEEKEDEEESYYQNLLVETAYLDVPDYSAGIFADSDILTLASDNYLASNNSSESNTNTLSRTTSSTGTSSINRSSSTSSTDNYIDTTAADRYNSYLKAYSARRGIVQGVTTEKGISTSDCVPHRISVEAYPEEAALADALGTRMYDIRFIHNTAITSRIKTGPVIGHTARGRELTEIGYSGVGQLGEVITFTDGTQRVEVLLKDGRSCWLYTSGNYTLDEICTRNGAPGSLADLTASEAAIRHYSRPLGDVPYSLV